MEVYTLLIAILFCILAIFKRPGYALGLLISSSLLWPEYLRFSVGIAEMSVPRLVGIVLFARLALNGRMLKSKMNNVDIFVLLIWFWGIFAAFMSEGGLPISRMVGTGLDTVLIYFVARWSMYSVLDIRDFSKPLIITALIMTAFAVSESITYYSPYHQLEQYRAWENIGQAAGERLGFLRARVSTSVPIFFGLAMVLLAGLIWTTHGFAKRKYWAYLGVASAVLGALTSLSSGPWVGCAILFGCTALSKRTYLIKPILYAILAMMVFIEIASNRHFYHMINYLGLSGGTAWYRVKLMEVMISHLDEFWAFGIGGRDTSHWVKEIGGQASLDIVNHFLLIAYLSGVPFVLLYVTAHAAAVWKGIQAFRERNNKQVKDMIFYAMAALIALDITSFSVGIYGPALIMSYIMLGILTTFSVRPIFMQKPTSTIQNKQNVNDHT